MKKHNQKKPISGYEKFITGFKAEFNTWLFTLYTVEKILRIINMIIKANSKSTDKKRNIKTKYDFVFSDYYQLEDNNGYIKANYLIGHCWGIVSINLTELFEKNKITFKIQKSAKLEDYHYHHITFEHNSKLDEFVEVYKNYWGNTIKDSKDVDEIKYIEYLEDLLTIMDLELLSYFEPIVHNYIY